MKILLNYKIKEHLSSLFVKFQIPLKNIENPKINALIEKFKDTDDYVSYADTEKVIACIYMIQNYGIPLKTSSEHLKVDAEKTFRLFKYLDIPTYAYIDIFIDFLMRFKNKQDKESFRESFTRIKNKSQDPFILAVALNAYLWPEKKFIQYDYYADVTIYKYKKIIESELNGSAIRPS
jgi:hypothetical protein